MKDFIFPDVTVAELAPVHSVMDDITLSTETPKGDNEQIVTDPAAGDEAVW